MFSSIFTSRELSLKTDSQTCEFCESKEATSACVECRQLACDICAKGHKRTKTTVSHLVVNLEEYRTNYENHPAVLKPSECQQHPGVQLKYYCQTCSVLTCVECTITDHVIPKHKHVYLSEAARNARNLVNGALGKVTDRLNYLDEKKEMIRVDKEKLTVYKEQAILKVEKQSQELVKKIQKNKEENLKNINETYEGKAKVLDSQFDRLELAVGQVKSSFEHSKNLIEQETDEGLMLVHKQTREVLESLLNEEIRVDSKGIHRFYFSSDPAFVNGRQGSVQMLPLKTVNIFGDGPGQFNWPSGVAASKAGDIFVCDFFNCRVQVFDMAGQYKKHFTVDTLQGKKVKLSDVAFNIDDNLVIADLTFNQVCVCDTDGNLLRQFGRGELKQPRKLAVSSDGHIHVADWNEQCVKTFSPERRVVRTIGCKGDQPGQFNGPHSIAVNSNGQIIVSDSGNHRVQVFDSSGAFLFMCRMPAEGDGEGQLQNPHGVTVDQYDNIIVCDYPNDCIQMFSPEGDYIGRVDDPSDGVKRPHAITTVPGQPLKLILTEFDDKNHMKLRIM